MECTEWRNAIWPRMFGPSITCNLIFSVSTIHHMKLMQRTASNYWNKSILTFNVVVLYMPLLLWLLRLLLLLWQYMCMGVIYRASNLSRSRGAAKFTKTHKIPRNSVEILSNTCLYSNFETWLSYWGYLLAVNSQIYVKTSSLKRANNVPKLPGIDYVAKNWALAMMLKALPLVHFWSVLLLKEQMMTSVRKTLKTLVWSVQNRSTPSEICPKITTKSAVFLPIAFRPSLPRIFPGNSCEIDRFFHDFVPKNPAKFDFFSATYQKPCI